jgi:hypothetical protein
MPPPTASQTTTPADQEGKSGFVPVNGSAIQSSCPAGGEEAMRRKRCWRCKKRGHLARSCEHRRWVPPSPTTRGVRKDYKTTNLKSAMKKIGAQSVQKSVRWDPRIPASREQERSGRKGRKGVMARQWKDEVGEEAKHAALETFYREREGEWDIVSLTLL